ncbi:MAG: hypothetical protein WC307_06820 [Candidatus Nanoarchaeia archaeon]|jgi:hypothetical protein
MTNYVFHPHIEGSFNLYGHDNIDLAQTKINVLRAFKTDYEEKIKSVLGQLGLKFKGLSYYSPKAYNYSGDSLTLSICKAINKEDYCFYLLRYRAELDEALSKNKSYDGYIATDIGSVDAELLALVGKKDFSPDCLIINWLVNKLIDFTNFYIYDHFAWRDEDDCDFTNFYIYDHFAWSDDDD